VQPQTINAHPSPATSLHQNSHPNSPCASPWASRRSD
jgi:hypothetical protein